jgi:hypothetical protein
MDIVESEINSGDIGPSVANLQDCLAFLLKRGVFVARAAPDSPTADELKDLTDKLAEERQHSLYGDAARRLITLWQLQYGLGDTRGDVDKVTADSLNAALTKYGAFNDRPDSPDPSAEYSVRGRITGRDGRALPNLVVHAYDQDLRVATLLGTSKTGEAGDYSIVYRQEDFAAADAKNPAPDLFIRVFAGSRQVRSGKSLADSPVLFNAAPLETMDLEIASLGECEFTVISEAIMPLLKDQGVAEGDHYPIETPALKPAELTPDDVPFLARESGLESDAITAWVQGADLQQKAQDFFGSRENDSNAKEIEILSTPDAWTFFFAACRDGLGPGLASLLDRGRDTWQQLLASASASGRIDPLKNEAELLDALQSLAALFSLDAEQGGTHPLAPFLAQAPLPPQVALEAGRIHVQVGEAAPDAFLGLTQEFPNAEADIQRFVRILRLDALTGGEQALNSALAATIAGDGHDLQPLAALSSKQWVTTVEKSGAPLVGAEAAQKAFDLQVKVENLLPVDSLNARVVDSPQLYAGIGLTNGAELLKNHGNKVETILANPLGNHDGLAADIGSGAVQGLSKLGLFAKAGLSFDAAANLVKIGVQTPAQVAAFGPDVLGDLKIPNIPQNLLTNFFHDMHERFVNSTHIFLDSAGSGGLFQLNPDVRPLEPGASGGTAPNTQPLENAPSFAGIFGSLDECLCRPCESVLGLPAYLVDLLAQLKTVPAIRPSGTTGTLPYTAQDALRAQRPDIFALPLGCDAAETEVLHIELAIEAMEHRVARASGFSGPSAGIAAAVDSLLGSASYPWHLPHDREWDRAQIYTQKLKLDRAHLLSSASNRPVVEAAVAWLGMVAPAATVAGRTSEWTILTNPAAGDAVWQHYGLSSAATVTVRDPITGSQRTGTRGEILKRLSILLDRTGLSLDELRRLIACRSIWPSGSSVLEIRSENAADPCKVSEMTLSNSSPALFDRLHRFVRLWRRLPDWTLEELDSALLALAPSASAALGLSDDSLIALAAIRRAQKALGVPVAKVLGLYANPTTIRPSAGTATLFDSVLLSSRVTAAERIVFDALANGRTLPTATPAWTMTRLIPALAAALGGNSRTMAGLVQASGGDTPSLDGIIWFYRRLVLSDRLGVPLSDVIHLPNVFDVDLTGRGASATPASAALWFQRLAKLAEYMPELHRSDIPVAVLDRLTASPANARPATESLEGLIKSPTQIQIDLDALRQALTRLPMPPLEPALEKELQTLLGKAFDDAAASGVLDEIASPSSARRPVHTVSEAAPAGFKDSLPLLSTSEAGLLFDSTLKIDLRQRFLYQRILERNGTAEERLRSALQSCIPTEAAERAVAGLLRFFSDTPDPALLEPAIEALTASYEDLPRPLFSSAEAMTLLGDAPVAPETVVPRIEEIESRIAEVLRDQQVISIVSSWTPRVTEGSAPAAWPTALIESFLGDRLSLEPPTRGDATRTAISLLSSPEFRDNRLSRPDKDALSKWARQLNLVLAGVQHLESGLQWLSMAGLDWRHLIEGQNGSEKLGLVHLLLAGQPDQLSLPVVAAVYAGADLVTVTTALNARLGPDSTALAEIAIGGAVTLDALRKPETLYRLGRLAHEARRLKATKAQMQAMLGTAPTAAADAAQQLLTLNLDPDAARKVEESARADCLTRRRDALLGWLVAHDSEMIDAGRVYERLLIDPEMSPCYTTTRVLAAIASVQLFIQRFLFGLEQDRIAFSDGQQQLQLFNKRWEWMRSYRLWEANRKVFLFPENWLFPELRDDRSAAFKTLESALGKGELTDEIAHDAFSAFLDEVAQAGQIQVIGMFEDVSNDPTRSRRNLYLLGRTPNPPYVYYWRDCRDFGRPYMEWAPWRRIELDITSDHALPFVLGGRLHIAWPKVSKLSDQKSGPDDYQLDLHVSALGESGWQEVRISRTEDDQTKPANQFTMPPFGDERVGLSLRAEVSSDTRTAIVKAYFQDQLANTTSTAAHGADSYYMSMPVPGEYRLASYLDTVKGLIKDGFDRMPDENKKILYSYALKKAANNEINPGARDSDRIFWGSPHFGGLDCFDFPYARSSYDDIKRNNNSIASGIINKIFLTSTLPPNTYFRNFIIDKFFDDMKSRFTSNGQTLAGFGERVVELLSGISERTIIVRAKQKITVNGVKGVVALNDSHGEFKLKIDKANAQPVQISDGFSFSNTSLGGFPETSAQLTWMTPQGSALTFQLLPIEAVQPGQQKTFTLNFILDDTTTNAVPTVRDIDLNFSSNLQFKIEPGRRITTIGLSLREHLNKPISDAAIYMNGYREGSANNGSAGLPLTINGVPAKPIFENSATGKRYWVTGAARTGSSAHAGIWSYREGNGKCLIDRYPFQNGLAFYPDGWHDEQRVLAQWHGARSLPAATSQHDRFGTALVPPSPIKSNDVQSGRLAYDNRMPYAGYNWEVFLHGPLYVADQLSRQQRYQEADRWYRLVFDPTSNDGGNSAARFFRFLPFRTLIGNGGMRAQLELLARIKAGKAPTGADASTLVAMIERWRNEPYRPFGIARRRQVAFLWRTLFAYVDNLVAWADDLFRRDTRETIGEALLLYTLIARILGRRPRVKEQTPERTPKSFDQIQSLWDQFGNAWIVAAPTGTTPGRAASSNAPSPGALYFCLPFNEKLTGYWDIIEDRLFKIRHCRNIEGVVRELPFMDPPIDPELLVRATAAGLDIGDVVAGLYAPPPRQRFAILLGRALDLANDTRALGGALLSALEKRDSEALSLLRSSHEIELLKRVQQVRTQQIEEAQRNIDALEATRKTAAARFEHLARLMGQTDVKSPAKGQKLPALALLGRPASGLNSAESNLGLIPEEQEQYVGLQGAKDWALAAGIAKITAGLSHALASPFFSSIASDGVGKVLAAVGHGASAVGDAFSIASQDWRAYADRNGMQAGHIRRRDEWAFQANQTLKEIEQIDQQILASEIRKSIAETELSNQARQIEQAEAVEAYLRSKYTNLELYQWMSGELSHLHARAYRMALDLSRQAQAAAVRELGLVPRELSILSFDHFQSGRSGLLAGERLHQELKQLEIAYHERNRRQHEMTKHVSLRLLDGKALSDLKLHGKCEFDIPEWMFDMDMPGHFSRRIKMVSLSIPCVTGPYVGVNCKLTLLRSDVRHNASPQPGYVRSGIDDQRFSTSYGPIESIVTSSGRDDSGMFEASLRDERYLPFEHAGVISRWRLEVPNAPPQFDHATISDAVLHMRYTARVDDALADPASQSLAPNGAASAVLLYSLKDEFSADWMTAKASGGPLAVTIDRSLLPYSIKAANLGIRKVSLLHLARNSANALEPVGDWSATTSTTGLITIATIAQLDDCLAAVEIG